MTPEEIAAGVFDRWFARVRKHKSSGGVAKGTISACLVVLERLRGEWNLNLESHRAAGGSQIKGASGAAVTRILARYGEARPFAKEGGRTNRGGPGDVKELLESLAEFPGATYSDDIKGEV